MVRRVCCSIFALLVTGAGAQPAWRGVEVPPGAHVQRVADDLVINGQRSQVTRLDITGTEENVLDFYRARFGANRVELRVNGARVIAARQGDRFVTVRVRCRLAGTVEGTVIATRINGGSSHAAMTLETEALLPADTAVLQTQESDDSGAPSTLLVAANRAGVRANRDAIVDQLRARGFRVVGEDARQAGGRESLTLTLSSPSEDAALTVSDAGAYRSLLIQRSRRRP